MPGFTFDPFGKSFTVVQTDKNRDWNQFRGVKKFSNR